LLSGLFLIGGSLIYAFSRPSALPFLTYQPLLVAPQLSNYLPDACWAAAFTAALWPWASSKIIIAIFVLLVACIVEIAQYYNIWGGYADGWDIIAGLAGIAASYLVLKVYDNQK
jgi:hypothetical protein